MNNVELRQFVVGKFNAKSIEFSQLKASVEAFCVGILVDCKDVIADLDSAKKIGDIIIDEIDDRTSTGIFDAIDGTIAKGIFEKYADTPKLEALVTMWRQKALNIINSNIPK